MAKKGKKGKGRKPVYNVQLSRKAGSEYKRVNLGGLWKAGEQAPEGIAFSGSLSGEYLEEAAKFLAKAAKKEATVYINVWEFKPKKKRDEDDDSDDDGDDDDDDDDDDGDKDDDDDDDDKDAEGDDVPF